MAWMNISRPNISASGSRAIAAGLVAAAALALVAVPGAVAAQAPVAGEQAPVAGEHAPELLARFHGDWAGTVMFRNVLTGESQTVGATLTGKPQGTAALLDMLLDDGKGRLVRQPFKISVNAPGQTFTRDPGDEAVTFRITSGNLAPGASEPVKLVLEGRGAEQAVPMDVRETIEIMGDQMVWRREMKPDGGQYGFRSEYRLTRKP
jgi:hypothetical protein